LSESFLQVKGVSSVSFARIKGALLLMQPVQNFCMTH